ncbi:NF-X1 type zinc finger family protein [Metarhizium rileyi]|uniref:NF-X1 type zinc finger family protein n=1 Tax=Metarhizium rileyi (strain RCEF 4871) TaxID=1649241 RepID=A0A167DLP9_METRR|nr:NF-X1 type zinc finger family protein [Metarhizium rileyi RCEF 4871]
MPDAEGSQAQSQSQRPSRARNHGHRRGRGGNSRKPLDGSRSGGSTAPAESETSHSQAGSIATQIQTQFSSQAPARSSSDFSNSGQRGRDRRTRGSRQTDRSAPRNVAPRPLGHRSFGGHLTSTAVEAGDESVSVTASLSADAPEFIPGKPLVTRSKTTKPKATIKPQVRFPKSTAEDLGTRIHEDISNFNYECAICTDDVVRTSHIWSCSLCWTVVHLKCVKRWHGNQKKQQDLQSTEPQQELSWRCPGCNSRLSDDPGTYHSCDESSACTAKAVISCPCGIRSQEVKCLASSSNPTPARIEIKCDDECLRLERNRRLAAALNIDPASHQNDHIPYSDATLRLFKENTSWAESQEREFRVFAKSPHEVRLRYKPMNATYRQFLHVLAEDYGLESRSEDVEPYRYVVVFKGTRFVSAPSKTLSQCVRIRATQAASRAPSPPVAAQDPFNGFLLTSPRFGLTIDDVRSAVDADLSNQPAVHFDITFLPSEEVLLRATTSYSAFLSPTALEKALVALKPRLAKTVEATDVAGKLFLCHVDSAGHVARRDETARSDASGWSAVAGRAAAKLDTAVEEAPRTTGRRLLGLRKKKMERERSWTEELKGDVEC